MIRTKKNCAVYIAIDFSYSGLIGSDERGDRKKRVGGKKKNWARSIRGLLLRRLASYALSPDGDQKVGLVKEAPIQL